MRDPWSEKRREPREDAAGPVTLQPEDPSLGADLKGVLVDVSRSGFRARHGCAAFYTGLEVGFVHNAAIGRARVVWNRIQGREVESGFLILAQGA